jgi:thiamine biosynthesis lipoprotein
MAALAIERDPAAPSASRRWRTWGTSVVVVSHPATCLGEACAMVATELAAFDAACSRFRDDSELSELNRRAGRPVPVGDVLLEAVGVSLRAAALTEGAVVPTVGRQLIELGYDRDFDELISTPDRGPLTTSPARHRPWQDVELDPMARTVTVPSGVLLDLGATAKALCADRAAARAFESTGAGVLVSIGGDVAMSGPPPDGGWAVSVVDDARLDQMGERVVALAGGGLASSGTTARSWVRGGTTFHHIVDPSTGYPADPVWRMVTVASGTCVDANTASTAAVVWGEEAPFRLAQLGLPSRLVRRDGSVERIGGWPIDDRQLNGTTPEGPR